MTCFIDFILNEYIFGQIHYSIQKQTAHQSRSQQLDSQSGNPAIHDKQDHTKEWSTNRPTNVDGSTATPIKIQLFGNCGSHSNKHSSTNHNNRKPLQLGSLLRPHPRCPRTPPLPCLQCLPLLPRRPRTPPPHLRCIPRRPRTPTQIH